MYVFISAEQASKTNQQNQAATKQLAFWLKDKRINHTPVIGCYEGKKETSFKVRVLSLKCLDYLKEQAAKHNQDCIITMLDNGSNVSLVFPDGSRKALGDYTQVSQREAEDNGSYTLEGNRYFVCK